MVFPTGAGREIGLVSSDMFTVKVNFLLVHPEKKGFVGSYMFTVDWYFPLEQLEREVW